MNKGWLYVVCRILNWVLPIVVLPIFCYICEILSPRVVERGETIVRVYNEETFTFVFLYFILMYVVYGITRRKWKYTRSRWFYETWIFVFAGIAIYSFLSNNLFCFNFYFFIGAADEITLGFGPRVMGIIFCILICLSKIVTLTCQTEKYKAGSEYRYENLLDQRVEDAAYKVEQAKDNVERGIAEANLERAKAERDHWYRNKN